jgi:hypothetical protein
MLGGDRIKKNNDAVSAFQDTATGDLKLRNWGGEGGGEGTKMRGKGAYRTRPSKSR